ncbi:MAG: putative Ig protein [Frankiales bacterium]|nr:putative Ig protein [Frankiales bacterium]
MVDSRQNAAFARIHRLRRSCRPAATLAVLSAAVAIVVTMVAPANASTIHAFRPMSSSPAPTSKVCSTAGKFSCFAERKTTRTPFVTNALNFTLTPANIGAAYNLPASTLTNTVAIIDAFETANAESDLAVYRAHYRLPACTTANGCFRKVGQRGSPSVLPTEVDEGWASETALDLASVSAACPTCHILLVEANSNGDSLFAAVKTATNLGAKFVTMSWGGIEMTTQASYDAAYFNVPGVAYFAATGDSGYNGGTSYPASSPKVIAVGGTSIEPDRSEVRGWYEQAWGSADLTEGGGSGCSTVTAKPAFQSVVSKTVCAKRAVSDISAAADPNFGGISVYESAQGGWEQIGGTSEAAPLVAAMYASAGVPDPRLAPVSSLYARASSFNDILFNANGDCPSVLCVAAKGWDGPTGLGTPNGVRGFGAIPTPNRISIHNPGTARSFTGARLTVNTIATDSVLGTKITYTATGLPPGTRMYANGTIIGNPTAPRTYVITVRATDATAGAATMKFSWVVTNHKIVATSKPHIVGTLKRGATVRVAPIAFRSDSVHGAALRPTVAVRWYVDGRIIRGAVHSAFKIPSNYRGHRISFRIVASIKYDTSYSYQTARSVLIK